MDEEQRAEQDRSAREAARLMFDDETLAVSQAIAEAKRPTRGTPGPRPSRSLVLRHLRALQETALGQTEFDAMRRRKLRLVLEVLDLVHNLASPESIILAGRIAQGHLEGPLEVHARLYGGATLESIVLDLEAVGVVEISFATADTRLGRLPRMLFVSDGIRFILTRCPRALYAERAQNLFTAAPINVMSLEDLRSRVEGDFSPGRP